MSIGDSLVFLRTKNDLTQAALAQTINIARSTLSNYESNNRIPDIYTLAKIADYFNVTLDFLVGHTSSCNNPLNRKNQSDPKIIFQYYDRLNMENKDYVKGLMVRLYKDELEEINRKKISCKKAYRKSYIC